MRALPYGGSTFADIEISEEGRAFLANLLRQLSAEQIRALFAGARVPAYPHATAAGRNIDNWVKAFQAKVDAIVNRPACPAIAVTNNGQTPTRLSIDHDDRGARGERSVVSVVVQAFRPAVLESIRAD